LVDQIRNGRHGFFDWCGIIRPVDLVEIYVISAQASETVFAFFYDAFTGCIFVHVDIAALVIVTFEMKFAFGKIPSKTILSKYLNFVAGYTTNGTANDLFT